MKRLTYLTVLTLLALVTSVSSCKKDEDATPTAPTNSTPTVSPPSDADGAFVAIKTISFQTVPIIGQVEVELGTAAAWFGTGTTFVDGGTVDCNTKALTKQSNNAYVFTPSSSDATGIDFSSGSADWTISGNSGNAVPAFSFNHCCSYPDVNGITANDNISVSSDYTLTATGAVTGADSVIFVMAGPDNHIVKIKPAGTSSCLFTAAELATLGTGSNVGLLQIAPYSWTSTIESGKKYYFIKETVVSKFVSLSN